MELKCKLCGGRLCFDEGSFSAKCDSCGVSQFIFDYLDKDSDDYDEQVEIIKSEKEEFEKTYLQYADDVINADSYCLTSENFKKAVDFFEQCGTYKDAPVLLNHAKIHFIGKVSSLSDCTIAIKYIDELDVFSATEKEEKKQAISDLAISFSVIDLDNKGYVAILPEEPTAENILCVMQKMSNAKDLENLNRFEKEVAVRCLKEDVEYIEKNISLAIKSCDDVDVINKMQELVPVIKKNFAEVQLYGIENIFESKIEALNEKNRVIEQQQLEKSRQQNRKKRFKKLGIMAIIMCVVLIISAIIIYKASGYSANNIDIAVISKSNIKINENLKDGYVGSGYFYLFEFEIANNNHNGVNLIQGVFEIVNDEGQSLSTSSLELHCDISKNTTEIYGVQLNMGKGNAARELWNSELEDLTIKFRIKSIRFEDGTYNNYPNTKNKIIYPQN